MYIDTKNIREVNFKSDRKIIDEDGKNEDLDTDQDNDFDIFGISMD